MHDSEIENFNNAINEEIQKLESDIKNGLNDIELQDRINFIIEEYSNVCSKDESEKIFDTVSERLQKHHEQMDDFYIKLETRWGKPIDLLEIFWLLSIDYGQNFSDEYHKIAEESSDVVFLTLKMLHGRACLVTGEIVTLLRNGYPDAAMARWRTLYEILIISDFIKKNGNDMALRYLEFDKIEEYQSLEDYQKNAKKLNKDTLSDEELATIDRQIQPFKQKYGKLFRNRFGWAFDLKISKDQNPTFKKIAQQSDYSHYYPYYTWASYPIHSGPKALTVVLGQPVNQAKVILAGPSDAAGIAEPGMMTGITFLQINVNFLLHSVTFPRLIQMKTLGNLEKKIKDSFYLASLNPIP
jgi:hypothetical protein